MAAARAEEVSKIVKDGVTPRELARSLNSRRASFLDQIASVLGKADRLASYDYNAGTPDFVQQDLARYEHVTAADVQRVAASYLTQPEGGTHRGPRRKAPADGLRRCEVSEAHLRVHHAAVAATRAASPWLAACSGPRVVTTPPPIPAPTTAPAPVATLDLTKPPTLGPPPSLRPPQISTRELPNGLKIVVLEQHELPLVDVILQIRSGGESDPAGKMGTAALVAAMLTEGTTNRTALQIADQAAYLGIQLNASSGWEQSNVSLHTPTAQLDSALALFSDVTLRPIFPTADLERVRKVRLTSLQQLRDRAPAIADRAFATRGVRATASLWAPARRYRGIARVDLARRGPALLHDLLPAEQRHAPRRWRRATGRRRTPRP